MRSESNTNDEILPRSRQKFILDRSFSLVASYCWRENWVSQAESIYSLLQKFAFLNALGARQIGAEVLSEPLRSVIQVKQVSVELTNVAAFDWSRLGHLFRIDTADLADAFLAHPHVDQSTNVRDVQELPLGESKVLWGSPAEAVVLLRGHERGTHDSVLPGGWR